MEQNIEKKFFSFEMIAFKLSVANSHYSEEEKFILQIFFSSLMYNHTASSQLYYKYQQNLKRLHAKYAQSTKKAELNLTNTARKCWSRTLC